MCIQNGDTAENIGAKHVQNKNKTLKMNSRDSLYEFVLSIAILIPMVIICFLLVSYRPNVESFVG